MLLWSVFALMTAVAILSVLWPLSRTAEVQAGSDLAVYRDQLEEVDRDRKAGLIGEAEAQAARVEVSRRLSQPLTKLNFLIRRRSAHLYGVVALQPWWRSFCCRLSPRCCTLQTDRHNCPVNRCKHGLRAVHQETSIAALVSQAEAHLERNPDDARGYEVLAPIYLRLGRFADAVHARRKLMASDRRKWRKAIRSG